MITQRHRAREFALQILYRYEVQESATLEAATVARELISHFDHFKIPDELREFTGHLVAGVLLHRAEIDPLIEANTPGWRVARMPLVDRSLLRIATFELKHPSDASHSTVIDEAVELAKTFGSQETPAFVNAVLDAIRTQLATASPNPVN